MTDLWHPVIGLWLSAFTSASLLPGSSEIVLAYLWFQQHNPWLLWLVATSGNLAGSLLNYWLGTQFHRLSGYSWYPLQQVEELRAQRWMERFGPYTLLLSWLPVVGDPLTLMAGVFRLRLWSFVLLVALAKGGRYAAMLLFADALLLPWVQS